MNAAREILQSLEKRLIDRLDSVQKVLVCGNRNDQDGQWLDLFGELAQDGRHESPTRCVGAIKIGIGLHPAHAEQRTPDRFELATQSASKSLSGLGLAIPLHQALLPTLGGVECNFDRTRFRPFSWDGTVTQL